MAHTTWIRNAAWIIAWDATAGTHVYLRDADLVFSGDTHHFLSASIMTGTADTIDRRARADADPRAGRHPLASQHRAVLSRHPRGARRAGDVYERAVRALMSPSAPTSRGGAPARRWPIARCCAPASPRWLICPVPIPAGSNWRRRADCGCSSPRASPRRAGIWRTSWQLKYTWDEAAGNRGLRDALALIARPRNDTHAGGCPASCSRRRSTPVRRHCCAKAGRRRRALDLPFTTHCAQSVNEFNEMVNRHGKTPIQWARDIGILGPRSDPRPRDLHRRAFMDALAHQG